MLLISLFYTVDTTLGEPNIGGESGGGNTGIANDVLSGLNLNVLGKQTSKTTKTELIQKC